MTETRTTETRTTERAPATTPATSEGLRLAGLHKVLGGRPIVDDLDLDVTKGQMVCLLGPSGCGKTTTLRMIAGFIEPDRGTVTIDGADVTRLPPERRPTAMVFQNYALWPHMSVFDNIAFGLKLRKVPKAEIARRVEGVLELVGLTHHIRSRPTRISGGEQQRVALARALVQEPKVLLLDEPLSNLDAKLRVRVREDIREIQQRLAITTVFVTHDQDEALSISDRVAVMNGGRIEQYASPVDIYRSPATTFVGGFVGATNPVAGRIERDGGSAVVTVGSARVPVGSTNLPDAESTRDGDSVAVRPEDVVVGDGGAAASVVRIIPRGHFTEAVLDLDEGDDAPVHAYVDAGALSSEGEATTVRFRRALVYREGSLL
jgi:ABC-type Fe3+/spermidine/putrescine transport system ATPase subunit